MSHQLPATHDAGPVADWPHGQLSASWWPDGHAAVQVLDARSQYAPAAHVPVAFSPHAHGAPGTGADAAHCGEQVPGFMKFPGSAHHDPAWHSAVWHAVGGLHCHWHAHAPPGGTSMPPPFLQ